MALLATLIITTPSRAQVVISNFPQGEVVSFNADDGLIVAAGFTMPAGTPVALTEARVSLLVEAIPDAWVLPWCRSRSLSSCFPTSSALATP